MLKQSEIQQVVDADAHGEDGDKIGPVARVVPRRRHRQPEVATVKTALFAQQRKRRPADGGVTVA